MSVSVCVTAACVCENGAVPIRVSRPVHVGAVVGAVTLPETKVWGSVCEWPTRPRPSLLERVCVSLGMST